MRHQELFSVVLASRSEIGDTRGILLLDEQRNEELSVVVSCSAMASVRTATGGVPEPKRLKLIWRPTATRASAAPPWSTLRLTLGQRRIEKKDVLPLQCESDVPAFRIRPGPPFSNGSRAFAMQRRESTLPGFKQDCHCPAPFRKKEEFVTGASFLTKRHGAQVVNIGMRAGG